MGPSTATGGWDIGNLSAAWFNATGDLGGAAGPLTGLLFAIPLPYIAGQVGWLVTEIGRQPWIVYGLLKTSDAVTQTVGVSHVAFSLIGFTLLYGLLAVVDVYLLFKFSRKGPDKDTSSILPRSKR